MRESCRAIIFKENKVVLIYRERENQRYYVFAGGGIEENETKEDCVIRECKEELGITVNPIKYSYKIIRDDLIQHFYLCEWRSGKLGTGNEEEYDINRKGGLQKPIFIPIEDISKLNVVPKVLKNQLLSDLGEFGNHLDDTMKIIREEKDDSE